MLPGIVVCVAQKRKIRKFAHEVLSLPGMVKEFIFRVGNHALQNDCKVV